MITPQNIMRLKLRRASVQDPPADVPYPPHVKSEQGRRFTVLSDAIVRMLTRTPEDLFRAQLGDARAHNMSLILTNIHGERVGITAAISTIRDEQVYNKSVIITPDMAIHQPDLAKHYIIGAFISKDTVTNTGKDGHVYIAGWVDSANIDAYARLYGRKPTTFATALPVILLPCVYLQPTRELYKELAIA